jgi:hypothetical protein
LADLLDNKVIAPLVQAPLVQSSALLKLSAPDVEKVTDVGNQTPMCIKDPRVFALPDDVVALRPEEALELGPRVKIRRQHGARPVGRLAEAKVSLSAGLLSR